MFRTLKWPQTDADLFNALDHFDQTPARTTALPVAGVNAGGKKKGRKSKGTRIGKVLNTHTGIDLTKDYVPPPPPASSTNAP